MKEENEYPEIYGKTKLTWIDNEPRYKPGDTVYLDDSKGARKIVLETVTKEPMQLRWLNIRPGRCCNPKELSPGKWVYRWNNGEYTEGNELDIVKRLTSYRERITDLEKRLSEAEEKANRFDRIQRALDGEDEPDSYSAW